MIVRCGKLAVGKYIIEISGENKKELKLTDTCRVINGFKDGTGKIRLRLLTYKGDTEDGMGFGIKIVVGSRHGNKVRQRCKD